MKKRVIRFFTNYDKEEQWLNEMAAQGWHLMDYVWGRYLFQKGKPGEYIYRIQLLENPIDHKDSAAYLEFLEEAGIETVASSLRWVYLRKGRRRSLRALLRQGVPHSPLPENHTHAAPPGHSQPPVRPQDLQ